MLKKLSAVSALALAVAYPAETYAKGGAVTLKYKEAAPSAYLSLTATSAAQDFSAKYDEAGRFDRRTVSRSQSLGRIPTAP